MIIKNEIEEVRAVYYVLKVNRIRLIEVQGGPKVSTHMLPLITQSLSAQLK